MKTFFNNDSQSRNRTVAFLQYCSLQLVDIPVQSLKQTQLHKALSSQYFRFTGSRSWCLHWLLNSAEIAQVQESGTTERLSSNNQKPHFGKQCATAVQPLLVLEDSVGNLCCSLSILGMFYLVQASINAGGCCLLAYLQ